MSLINDALKKAQRQHSEGTVPAQPPSTPPVAGDSTGPLQRVARREKPPAFQSQLVLVGIGAGAVVVLLAVGAFFYFRSSGAALKPVIAAQTAPAQTPGPSLPVAAPAVAVPPPAVVQPAPVTVADQTKAMPAPVAPPAATLPAVAAAPAPTSDTGAIANQAGSEPDAPNSVQASKPNEHPKPSNRMVAVIESLKVTGIRSAGPDSKVLMNDRVYRLNDIVDHELGIRLTAVAGKTLTFEDDHGVAYSRTF